MNALYRLLLHLYPKSFRHEYGGEMADDFARARADAGSLRAIGLLIKAVADVGRNAVAVHWNILRQDLRYTVRRPAGGRRLGLQQSAVAGELSRLQDAELECDVDGCLWRVLDEPRRRR